VSGQTCSCSIPIRACLVIEPQKTAQSLGQLSPSNSIRSCPSPRMDASVMDYSTAAGIPGREGGRPPCRSVGRLGVCSSRLFHVVVCSTPRSLKTATTRHPLVLATKAALLHLHLCGIDQTCVTIWAIPQLFDSQKNRLVCFTPRVKKFM
jgi:hypothetical protein